MSTDPAPTRAPNVFVVARRGQASTVAAQPFVPGDEILVVDGELTDRPSRTSVQIAPNLHVEVPADVIPDGADGRLPWRFLNHSCRPNAVLRGRTLVARLPIARGADITFDYEANEWDMAAPFRCDCGEPECRGWIRGYRHLSPAQRTLVATPLAEHLAALAALAERAAR